MSVNGGIWVAIVQFLQELLYCYLLRLSSCIFRGLAIFGESSDVADTDTVGVMSSAVCSCLCDWSPGMYAAVAIDDVVIADVFEVLLQVPLAYLRYGVVAPLWGCATVYDEFTDCSHLRLPVVVVRRNTF